MKQADRTKVCWNCEADVNYEATYCPFCGTDLLTSSAETSAEQLSTKDDRFTSQSLHESLASLYKPPYSVRSPQGFGVPDEREDSTFKPVSAPKEDPLFQSYESEEEESVEDEVMQGEEATTERGSVLPLLLLTVGLNLITLGILIFFFKKDGVVHLEWSSSYWFLFLVFGAPLAYLGIRLLRQFAESDNS